jgi:hypothetical protein
MNREHDWAASYRWITNYVRRGKLKREPGQLFLLDHAHNDGAVVLFGKGRLPLYVLVASHGPFECGNLVKFLPTIASGGNWIHTIGNKNYQPPWFAVVALAVVRSMTQDERNEFECRFNLINDKLKTRFKQRLANN